MGCGMSTSREEKAPMDDFSSKSGKATNPTQTSKSKDIRVNDDLDSTPPAYTPPGSIANLLQILKDAHEYRSDSVGVNGAFDSTLRHRHIQLWIDENPNQPKKTQCANMFIAMLLLTMGKAFNSNMEIFFTGYSNKDSKKVSEAKRRRAASLDNLFNTENWDDAVTMIEGDAELRHHELRLDRWLHETQNIKASSSLPQVQNIKALSCVPTSGSMSSGSPKARMTSVTKDEEKHLKLLGKVRELKTLYWQGWHRRDLDVKNVPKLYLEAATAMDQQPRNLNNSRFTIERAIALQKRLHEEDDAQPTSVFIITGSPLLKSETQAIQKDLKQVQGGAYEFSIETLLYCENLDHQTIYNHREIDDSLKGDRDIYDVSEMRESQMLEYGPSPKQLVKFINSHIKAVDDLKFRDEKDKYGPVVLTEDEDFTTIPSVQQVKDALGL